MTYSPFSVTDSVFGDNKSIEPTPIIQMDNRYSIDPSEMAGLEIFTATGGSADNNGNNYRVQSGTSLGGYGVIRSIKTANYRAGQSITALFTAKFTTGVALSEQGVGFLNVTDALLVGYDGENFSFLHQYDGVCEVQEIEVTATGAGSVVVTLDSVSSAPITLTNTSIEENAYEIKKGIEGDASLNSSWRAEAVGAKVFVISQTTGNKTGTMSVSFTGATGTITENVAGADKASNYIPQANWDAQPFAGFDPTNLNLYKIEFGYLGAANSRLSIYNPNTGEFTLVHQLQWVNNSNTPLFSQPNMKLGMYAASLGSTGANLTVEAASGCVFIDGKLPESRTVFSSRENFASLGTSLTPVFNLRNRVVINNRYALGFITVLTLSAELDHTKGAILDLYLNPTITGAETASYADEFNSIALVKTNGTGLTGGRLIDSYNVASNGAVNIDLSNLNIELFPEDELVIAARTVSGTATLLNVSLTWRERF